MCYWFEFDFGFRFTIEENNQKTTQSFCSPGVRWSTHRGGNDIPQQIHYDSSFYRVQHWRINRTSYKEERTSSLAVSSMTPVNHHRNGSIQLCTALVAPSTSTSRLELSLLSSPPSVLFRFAFSHVDHLYNSSSKVCYNKLIHLPLQNALFHLGKMD